MQLATLAFCYLFSWSTNDITHACISLELILYANNFYINFVDVVTEANDDLFERRTRRLGVIIG